MKQIEDFPDYFIDENGEVWSNKFNKWRKLKPGLTKKGYLQVVLCKDGKEYTKKMHRLIAETFIPNPKNLPHVRHLDDNPLNNSIQNLAWGTNQDNVDDRVKNEGYLNQPKGEKQHSKQYCFYLFTRRSEYEQ